jgi:predicted amidohydrolase YtcJ
MRSGLFALPVMLVLLGLPEAGEAADLILQNGKVATVDRQFSIHQAIAVKDGRILAVGSNEEVLKLKTPETSVFDLGGKLVLPGLIDSHVHPAAAMTEFDHEIPVMESIADVLSYVRARAEALPDGEWIQLRQVFITRLEEQRYPTRAELDAAAPNNPVVFATGPDASVNSLALKLSGIDKDFKVTDGGPGFVEKDPATGELTGILRSCGRFVKAKSTGRQPTEEDEYRRTLELFKDYNSVGITAVADRSASADSLKRFAKMRDNGDLPVRMSVSYHIDTIGPMEKIKERIRAVGGHPLRKPDPMLKVVGIKTFLDGGMLTGSAYMREPWGKSEIYSITDPEYRGTLLIPRGRLLPIVRQTVELGLQFTAHSVGDGAVHTLLDVYNEVNKTTPLRETRPCVTHSNFMSREAIDMMVRLGVVADIQPAWLWLDTRTLEKQFGYDRLRWFQPLKSIFEAGAIAGGGSDHMQKIGSLRSVNPYNPFLAMRVAITRNARWHDHALHPEEAISREQAIRFYTINNAYLLFREREIGSIEVGKLADLVVLDRDLLTCPVNDIRDARVLRTYLGGKAVFSSN